MTESKYDFHVHYKAHARDATGHEEAMVQRAVEVGLTGICFTEHFQRLPGERLLELRAKYPQVKIWSGVEVNCAEGNDLLVFGKADIDLLTGRKPWEWIYDYCEHNDFAVCLAHPFRKARPVPDCFVKKTGGIEPDYVEISSRNTPTWAASYVADLFLMSQLLVNSDAHKPRQLGWHFNYRDDVATGLAECLERMQ